MGCDFSKTKDKDKKKDDKKDDKKHHHHHRHHSSKDSKKQQKTEEDRPSSQPEQEPETLANRAATPPPAAATPSDRPAADTPLADVQDVAAAEQEQRADIERDAYVAQEALDRDHIEQEADTTSPIVDHPAEAAADAPLKEGVSTRTVKRRPEGSATPRNPASHPTHADGTSPRAIPTTATIFTKDGARIDVDEEEAKAQQQSTALTTTVLGGELMPHPTKEAPTWKVMRPPQQDGSSWRLLRQVRMVFQLRNVTAI